MRCLRESGKDLATDREDFSDAFSTIRAQRGLPRKGVLHFKLKRIFFLNEFKK